MREIRLVNSSKGWLARFVNDEETVKLFGTDTIPTAFTENASPVMVKKEIQKLNPGYIVKFN